MDASERLAKATIAAALIGARAVEVPSPPEDGFSPPDTAALRLRQLTDYIYDLLTKDDAPTE